jgi:hypothetical protein
MRREQIDRRKLSRERKLSEILPLDPRDPAIIHAKELVERSKPPRRPAA